MISGQFVQNINSELEEAEEIILPEKRLHAALLDSAIHDLERYKIKDTLSDIIARRVAIWKRITVSWIDNKDPPYLISFEQCLEVTETPRDRFFKHLRDRGLYELL